MDFYSLQPFFTKSQDFTKLDVNPDESRDLCRPCGSHEDPREFP